MLAIADNDLDEWVVGEMGPDSLPAPRSVQRLVPVERAPYLPDDENFDPGIFDLPDGFLP